MHKKCRYPDNTQKVAHKVIHMENAVFQGDKQLCTKLSTLSTECDVEKKLIGRPFNGTDVLASSTNFTKKLQSYHRGGLTERRNYFL